MFPKGEALSDPCFPKSRLAFMDTKGNSFSERGAIMFKRESLVVEGVASFMENGEKAEEGIFIAKRCCHPDVAGMESHTKGVGGKVKPGCLFGEMDGIQKVGGEFKLLVLRARNIEAGVIGGWLFCDLAEERRELGLQACKERV